MRQEPPTNLTVLSLGAGVQSSCLALMAARGDLPRPDCAVFADTKAESRPTYEWLDWLEARLPFPVYRVQFREGLLADVVFRLRDGNRGVYLPGYTPTDGGGGQLRRQCTRYFKIRPINGRLRSLLGLRRGQRVPPGTRVTLWLGISLDESLRMKPSQDWWIEHQWPLIDRRMTRADCVRWLAEHDYPRPPRSACVCCPYRSNHDWRELRDSDADGWQQAIETDHLIRDGVRGDHRQLFLHPSLRPLEDVDLSTPREHGQLSLWEEAGCDAGYCWT